MGDYVTVKIEGKHLKEEKGKLHSTFVKFQLLESHQNAPMIAKDLADKTVPKEAIPYPTGERLYRSLLGTTPI